MQFIQGRIFAKCEDNAAMKIREEYGEGQLTILEVGQGQYEYMIRTDKNETHA